jgi:hypothetical protein
MEDNWKMMMEDGILNIYGTVSIRPMQYVHIIYPSMNNTNWSFLWQFVHYELFPNQVR